MHSEQAWMKTAPKVTIGRTFHPDEIIRQFLQLSAAIEHVSEPGVPIQALKH